MTDEVLPKLCKNFRAYGFEASAELAKQSNNRFSGRPGVKIIHAALCYHVPDSGEITLHVDEDNGLGSSVYPFGQGRREQSPAIRLTQWLNQLGLDLRQNICLLRMNIEGAEYDVVKDLVENRVAEMIDGYFGMWDDLSKINAEKDREFRQLLKSTSIRTFTFNGRDMQFGQRKACIKYEVSTALRIGAKKVSRGIAN